VTKVALKVQTMHLLGEFVDHRGKKMQREKHKSSSATTQLLGANSGSWIGPQTAWLVAESVKRSVPY
jgi:hypothetical protein